MHTLKRILFSILKDFDSAKTMFQSRGQQPVCERFFLCFFVLSSGLLYGVKIKAVLSESLLARKLVDR